MLKLFSYAVEFDFPLRQSLGEVLFQKIFFILWTQDVNISIQDCLLSELHNVPFSGHWSRSAGTRGWASSRPKLDYDVVAIEDGNPADDIFLDGVCLPGDRAISGTAY